MTTNPAIIKLWLDSEKIPVLKMLVANGIDPNVANKNGVTKLWLAAVDGNVEIVKYLLTLPGIDVNKHDKSGNTHLRNVYFYSVIKLLVDAGANVNAINDDGNTPIMHTKEYHAIRYLISHKADLTIKNKKGQSAYDISKNPEWLRSSLDIMCENFAELEDKLDFFKEISMCKTITDNEKIEFANQLINNLSKVQKLKFIQDIINKGTAVPANAGVVTTSP